MPKFKTKEEAYKSCAADGYLRKGIPVNKERIKALTRNADTNIASAQKLKQSLSKQDREWMTVYTLHYEAIRVYVEAFLLFENMMSENHQCLFAYLCVKHPEFTWDFFETIRRKRNGANYYGEQISYEEWKEVEKQCRQYILILKKLIQKKLPA